MTLTDFAQRARSYCDALGGSVTSWGRSRLYNGTVGGVAHSAHIAWLAVDVVYDTAWPVEERRAWAERLGLRLIVEADHDHLQPSAWGAG